jgi:hypothetical protein
LVSSRGNSEICDGFVIPTPERKAKGRRKKRRGRERVCVYACEMAPRELLERYRLRRDVAMQIMMGTRGPNSTTGRIRN